MNHPKYDVSENRSPEQIESEIEQTRAQMQSTLDQIQRKLSPGQMVDEALSYLRHSGAGDFTSNFGATVRHNPVPVTLMSVGIAWLMMATRQERHPSSHSTPDPADIGWQDPAAQSTRERIGEAMTSFGAGAGEAGSKISSSTPDLGDRVSTSAHNVRDRVSTGHNVSERAATTAHNVSERVGQVAGGARDGAAQLASGVSQFASDTGARAAHLASSARDSAYRVGDIARHQYDRARSGAEYLAHEQPLVLGALGLAVGAAIGASLPTTQREDRWMGETRDDLVETGKQQFQDAKETVQDAAQRTKDQFASSGETQSATDGSRSPQGSAGDTQSDANHPPTLQGSSPS